jgi:hypothetical protein
LQVKALMRQAENAKRIGNGIRLACCNLLQSSPDATSLMARAAMHRGHLD